MIENVYMLSIVEFNEEEVKLIEEEEGLTVLEYKLDKKKDGNYYYDVKVKWND